MDNKVHHIKIKNPESGGVLGTTVELDGKKIRCRGIDYSCHVEDGIPEIVIEILGTADIDLYSSEIKLDICPTNLKEAIIILRNELLNHGDLYDSFSASITSALNEVPNGGCYTKELSEHILKRIMGEE